MPDINTAMRDWLLRNSHWIHRFENGTIQELVRPYNKAKTTIIRRLAELDLAPAPGRTQFTKQWRIQRLQNILGEVNKTLELAALEGVENLASRVNDLAFVHADSSLYDEMAGRMNTVGISMNQLPVEQVLHIAEKPMLGEILLRDDITDRLLWGNQQAVQQMRNQLTQGIMLGDDMGKISRRLVGVGQAMGGEVGKKIQNRAKVIARTEVQRVSNAVTKNFYDANQDVIKGVQYTATLDRRTCLRCSPLDGRVYYYSGAVRGVKSAVIGSELGVLEQFSETGDLAPTLPQHPLCRCTYVPITKSWKELGLDIKEAPPGTRASLTGQIPATMTYGQWLATQPEAFQLEVLGPTRLKMWKEGKIKFTEMARDGKIVSIEQLNKLIARRPVPIVEPPVPKPVVPKPKPEPVTALTPLEEWEAAKAELEAYIQTQRKPGGLGYRLPEWKNVRGAKPSNVVRYHAKKLHEKEFDAYVKYYNSLSKAKRADQRAKICYKMIDEGRGLFSPLTRMQPFGSMASPVTRTVNGTNHLPIEMLADLQRNGLKVKWYKRGSDG
ncbi:MAG: phage minor head protein, partial [Candidatus Thorarchaeota archaeon]